MAGVGFETAPGSDDDDRARGGQAGTEFIAAGRPRVRSRRWTEVRTRNGFLNCRLIDEPMGKISPNC